MNSVAPQTLGKLQVVIKTNCHSVLRERKKVKRNKAGGKKDYMFFYIHVHRYVLYTRALLM